MPESPPGSKRYQGPFIIQGDCPFKDDEHCPGECKDLQEFRKMLQSYPSVQGVSRCGRIIRVAQEGEAK